MEKLERDGQVAVLISRGYGAGWSTWNDDYPQMLFDPFIAQVISESTNDDPEYRITASVYQKLMTYCALKYPDAYLGGLADLVVVWLPRGEVFRVEDYDGSESIQTIEKTSWIRA